MQSSHEHNVDHRLEGARGKIFGAGDEVSGRIVYQDIERGGRPDRVSHLFNGFETADVAGNWVDGTFRREFGCRGLQHFPSAAADVDRGPEFEEALSHAFA